MTDLPFPLVPSPAEAWRLDAGTISATAAPQTDIFIDPDAGTVTLNAATLLGVPPEGDYQLSARVGVGFGATYDAGVLLVRVDDRHWAKLCFEFSPAAEPMIVSVVCQDVADDANAFVHSGESVWLRAARVGRAYAFHASTDGQAWQLIRHFRLDGTARIGFAAQSPTGAGCQVTFDGIRFDPRRLPDLRDGH
jgi:regulation of enolase protein 1 (concanavalin A-like superfamily)